MPVSVSYPGVYVQEINTATPTITGVATSITAFVGRTYWGPVNVPTTIFSFGDFQRYFGGLMNNYPLGFAVRDFFQNGGAQAIIVRIYGPYWLEFPQTAQQSLAATAAEAVITAIENQTTSPDVTTAAQGVAATYTGGPNPQQALAANYMADQAYAWSNGVLQFTTDTLNGFLDQVATEMNVAAAAVVPTMTSPASYPGLTFPPTESVISDASGNVVPSVTSAVEAAQAAAATMPSGAGQDAAYLVANAVQAKYAADPTATFDDLVTAGNAAAKEVDKGLDRLTTVAATGDPDPYLEEVVGAIWDAGASTVNIDAALIAANATLAFVLPAFQIPEPPTAAITGPLGKLYLNQLYDTESPTLSLAVSAAVPSTTAALQIQVPANFLAVAGAANSVAQAAWMAALGQVGVTDNTASGLVVQQAAMAEAAAVQANNQALPAAGQAATAVAVAVSGKLMSGAQAAATAGTNAVVLAVVSALQLPSSGGAATALDSANQVAVQAWAGAFGGTPNLDAVATAVKKAASHAAAEAVAGLYTQGLTSSSTAAQVQAAAEAMSNGLVNATAGALNLLVLYAANAGEWANGSLTVTVNTTGISNSAVASLNLTPAPGNPPFGVDDFFNLVVSFTAPTGSTLSETWNMVSLRADAGVQRIDVVLSSSILVQYQWPGYVPGSTYPTTPTLPPPPAAGAYGVAGVPAVPAAATFGVGTPAAAAAAEKDLLLQGTPSAPLQLPDYLQNQSTSTGIYALNLVTQFDLLCIPPDTQVTTLPPAIPGVDPDDTWRIELYNTAALLCQSNYAMLILDPLSKWALDTQAGLTSSISIDDLGTYGPEGEYAAVYFPLLVEGNPLLNGQLGYFAPSGAIAGIMARTDTNRGVWKAPAGVNDGAISGTMALEVNLSDTDSGLLNPQGINCLRTFPIYGNVVWGARTLKGADVLSNPYKYIPVRRLALFIEASLLRGLQWAVFEPNADPLWSAIRLSVGAFMNTLFRQGAFAGSTASTAYFVACDSTTTTPTDIAQGIVNVTVGFAPLLPAEFVVISIQQIAGQTPT